MDRTYINHTLAFLMLLVSFSCSHSNDNTDDSEMDHKPEVVVKKRADGTISSVNQVDEWGMVDGIRVTYYPDGKTIYSKHMFNHGIKMGASIAIATVF
jgi:hypothetical protein